MANANIFAQFARPVRSIAEYQDDAMQREAGALNLEGARRKNAMDAMTMQQGQEKRNAIQSILAGLPVNASDQQRIAAFRSNPNTLGEADALEKSVLERQKVGADVGKTDAETLTKHLSVLKDLAGSVMSDPTPQNAQLSLQIFERLTGRQMPEERQRIAGLQTPEQVKAWAAGHAIQAEKLLPKLGVQNQGDANVNTATDVLTGKVTTTGSMPINQSADNAATNLTRAEEGAAGRKVQLQIAGQADARAREGLRLQDERLAYDKTKPQGAAAKPMPAAALKMQDEDLNAIGTFAGIDADLAGIEKQLTDGKLSLGLVSNVVGQGRNYVGASNENSRNLATFKAKLENMRNSVLLLNKGVQTEGDAQRAMNEMIANINDPEVVKQRLQEIRALNQRAVQLKKNNVDMVRRNYGQEDMDYSKYESQPPATNLPKGGALSPEDAQAREWATKNPNDPRAKKIMQRLGGG